MSAFSPAVRVVTPTKNRLVLLRETMDSVRRQSLDAWEHIIVDDGSNDGTADEVRKCAKGDPRVRFLQRTGERKGANVCRNQGLAGATADLIVFLDSDDLMRPDCLKLRVEVMNRRFGFRGI
jgi:glycosyltransferase involved in cell wall biosynthesis